MGQKNIIIMVVIGLVAALFSFWISGWLAKDIDEITYESLNKDITIPSEFPQLDPEFFNENSIDTFEIIEIGPTPSN